MRNPATSAATLLADVTEKVKNDLLASLAPITQKIVAAANELESALSGPAARVARRGPGGRKGPARRTRAARKTGAAPAKAKAALGRNPRGTLQKAIRSVMQGAGAALSLAGIRNEVLKSSMFRGRNPKTLYTQIVQGVKRIPEIQKTDKGLYAIKAAAAGGRSRKAAAK